MYPLAWHPEVCFPGEVTSFNVYFVAQSLINSFIYALFPPGHLQWLKWKLSLVLLCVTLTSRSPLPEFRMNCSLSVWLPWIGNTLLWELRKGNHKMLSSEILQVEYGVHFQAVGLAPTVQSSKQESQTLSYDLVLLTKQTIWKKNHICYLNRPWEALPFHSVAWFCVITWISFYLPYQSNLSKSLFNLCLTRLICMHVEKEMRKF